MLRKKNHLMDMAELVDAWRVFPRFFLLSCFASVFALTDKLVTWYIHLPKDERTAEASGFAALALASSFAFLKLVYSTYAEGGRDWTAAQPQTRTEKTEVTATTGVTS